MIIAALYVLQALGYVGIGVGFWMLLRLAGEVQGTRQRVNQEAARSIRRVDRIEADLKRHVLGNQHDRKAI